MSIRVELPNGGDEAVDPKRLLYIRDPLGFELSEEPQAQAVLMLSGVKLYSITARDKLSETFSDKVPLARLTAPNDVPIYVHASAVKDVDDPVSTNPANANAWLVFGTGPRAPRLSVQEDRPTLKSIWTDLGADPDASGI
jgi:hypothetical protein